MEIVKSIYDLAAVELRSRGITTISQAIVNGLGCLQLLGFDELAHPSREQVHLAYESPTRHQA